MSRAAAVAKVAAVVAVFTAARSTPLPATSAARDGVVSDSDAAARSRERRSVSRWRAAAAVSPLSPSLSTRSQCSISQAADEASSPISGHRARISAAPTTSVARSRVVPPAQDGGKGRTVVEEEEAADEPAPTLKRPSATAPASSEFHRLRAPSRSLEACSAASRRMPAALRARARE